ncbi:seipin-like, partial [Stegodyphus dumicola]|uniref:seipin-like n=1 Tax=Stegodyphus dumicola TaxID=202533 RepID=UPI0015A88B2C
MPESERNLDLGMFMIQIHMLAENGAILKSSRRPALLHYRSPLFKIIYTLFYVPALLAGSVQEKQTIVVPLFEHYVEDSYQPTHFAYIHFEAPKIEIYSCKLRIHAQFTGLRYMMYYWPILSAIIGIGFNFCWLSMIVIIIWLRQLMNTSQFIDPSALSTRERQQLEEIRLASRNRPQNTEVEKAQETSPQRGTRTGGISRADRTGIENLSAHY